MIGLALIAFASCFALAAFVANLNRRLWLSCHDLMNSYERLRARLEERIAELEDGESWKSGDFK